MKLSGLKCPNCGGSIENFTDGRTTLFCTYCGCQLSVEYDKGEVSDIIAIKSAQTKLNYSEEKLNYSKATLYKENAHRIEASTESLKYQDSRKNTHNNTLVGVIFLIIGLLFIVGSILAAILIKNDRELYFLFAMAGVMLGLLIMMMGADSISKASPRSYEKAVKRLSEIDSIVQSIEEESKELRETISDCGSSIIGKKAAAKKMAKQRLKELSTQKKSLEQEAASLRSHYLNG